MEDNFTDLVSFFEKRQDTNNATIPSSSFSNSKRKRKMTTDGIRMNSSCISIDLTTSPPSPSHHITQTNKTNNTVPIVVHLLDSPEEDERRTRGESRDHHHEEKLDDDDVEIILNPNKRQSTTLSSSIQEDHLIVDTHDREEQPVYTLIESSPLGTSLDNNAIRSLRRAEKRLLAPPRPPPRTMAPPFPKSMAPVPFQSTTIPTPVTISSSQSSQRSTSSSANTALGKNCHLEIAVQMEKRISQSSTGIEIQDHLKHALFRGLNTPYTLFTPHDSTRRGIIKWWWKSSLGSPSSPHEPIPYLVLYWSGVEFLTCILEKGHENMKTAIASVRQAANHQQSRICFIVQGLHAGIYSIGRNRPGCAAIRTDIQSTVFHTVSQLYLDMNCVTKFTVDDTDTAQYLVALTRELSYIPYRIAEDHLDFLPRLNSFHVLPDGTSNVITTTWLHMLQMIPGLSASKAGKMVSAYPTLQSFYSNVPNTNTLMAKTGFSNKVAARILLILTSTEPNTSLI